MYNSRPQIKIGDKWSYEAWGAFLGEGWKLAPASPKTSFLEVPSRDGAIDITDVLAGEPRFARRQLSFNLIIIAPESEWEHIRQDIENYCNGLNLPIVLAHDQSHYLVGRVSTGEFTRGSSTAEIAINVNCEPWRYKNKITNVKIEAGENDDVTKVIKNERRRVIPRIESTGAASITINGVTHNVSAGSFRFTDFALAPGKTAVRVVSAPGAIINIIYQEAVL